MPATNIISTSQPMGLCKSCKSKPARHFICEIVDQKETKLELCDDCMRIYREKIPVQLPKLDGTEACYYCGEPATSASMNQREQLQVRQQKFHFTCHRCFNLEHKFFMDAVGAIPLQLPQTEQAKLIEQAIRDVDQKVRDAASGRKEHREDSPVGLGFSKS
jgi:hypothetical protein